MDKFLGKTLENRYLIEELIGVGGMANVYKGFDRVGQRTVAIKMLREEYAQNEEFLRRFRDESRAIYSLNHPNIVKIYDVILNNSAPSIVMEYVDGVTLKDFIYNNHVYGIKNTVAITLQLLQALGHAHDNGIIHRDVKPQNIMVQGDGAIKVMDFGIARFAMSQSRTISRQAIGSVHYISPEQAKGDGVIDQQSDIYSVGIILYEMLTGQLPFEGENPIAVAMKQIDEIAVSPSLINGKIPQGLEEIVLKAMAKNPSNRYVSTSEMLQDLTRFIQNPAIVFGYSQTAFHLDTKSEAQKFIDGENVLDNNNKTANTKRSVEPRAKTQREEKKVKKKKKSFLAILFGITCAFVVGTLCFVGYMFMKNKPFEVVPEVDMPNIVGKNFQEVEANKDYEHFTFVITEEEYSLTQPAGYIYGQYPTSGKSVKEGSTVKVKLSKGPQTVTMPDFTGEEESLVSGKLQQMGLTVERTLSSSDTIKEGMVIVTDPLANETVAVGSTVMVYVSGGTGKEKTVVPNVAGQDLETAKLMIREAGLNVGKLIPKPSEFGEGLVVSQDPNYPAPIDIGGTVNLVVSSNEPISGDTPQGSVLCMLPQDISEQVHVVGKQDGMEFYNEMVYPIEKRVISVNVPGEYGVSEIAIYINDKVYAVYEVDFNGEKPITTQTIDNSVGFKP